MVAMSFGGFMEMGVTTGLTDLVALAHNTTREQFVSRIAHPFLSLTTDLDSGDSGLVASNCPTAGPDSKERPRSRSDDKTYFSLLERPSSPYPGRLWVGRTSNCDVVLKRASVSRLHAYFFVHDDPKQWGLAD